MHSRRELLRHLSASATATLALPEPRARGQAHGAGVVHPAARADAIIVQMSLQRAHAIRLSLKHKLITVQPSGPFVEAGGLL